MDYPARFEWQTRCEFNAYCKRTLRNELIDATACRSSALPAGRKTSSRIAESSCSLTKLRRSWHALWSVSCTVEPHRMNKVLSGHQKKEGCSHAPARIKPLRAKPTSWWIFRQNCCKENSLRKIVLASAFPCAILNSVCSHERGVLLWENRKKKSRWSEYARVCWPMYELKDGHTC